MVERTNRDQSCAATSAQNLRSFELTARSMGKILERALTLVERGLLLERQYGQAERLRDEIKPVVDWLVHLDLTWVREERADGDEEELS